MASSPRQCAPLKPCAHPTQQQHWPLPCNCEEPKSPILGATFNKSHSSRKRVILVFEFVGLLCPSIPSSSKTGCNSRDYHPHRTAMPGPGPLHPAGHVLCPSTGQTLLHHTQYSAEMPKSPGSLASQTPTQKFTSAWFLNTASRLLILLIDTASKHKRASQVQLNSLKHKTKGGKNETHNKQINPRHIKLQDAKIVKLYSFGSDRVQTLLFHTRKQRLS